jgi:hypothetical protein
MLVNQIGPMVRGHWMIENGLHWTMDMIFRDVRMPRAHRQRPRQFRHRRKVAAWDDEFLASLIAT